MSLNTSNLLYSYNVIDRLEDDFPQSSWINTKIQLVVPKHYQVTLFFTMSVTGCSKPLHCNKNSVIESHFGVIPFELSQFLNLKFLHFYHPYSIPIFNLSIICLHSLFTFACLLTKFLKIFLMRIILRSTRHLLPIGYLSSVFTPLHKINPFQPNCSFLYPLKISGKLRFSVFRRHRKGTLAWNWLKWVLFSQGRNWWGRFHTSQTDTLYIFTYLSFGEYYY